MHAIFLKNVKHTQDQVPKLNPTFYLELPTSANVSVNSVFAMNCGLSETESFNEFNRKPTQVMLQLNNLQKYSFSFRKQRMRIKGQDGRTW